MFGPRIKPKCPHCGTEMRKKMKGELVALAKALTLFVIGVLLCITIIGAIVGIPLCIWALFIGGEKIWRCPACRSAIARA